MTHCLVNSHVTDDTVFVLVRTECGMMGLAIDNPASCEIPAGVLLLRAKNNECMLKSILKL
jgi:hypothetical protein